MKLKIARNNVNKTAYTGDMLTRASFGLACQIVSIFNKATNLTLVLHNVAIATITIMMQTTTSMMIIMPSRGGR
mgnify:FL=1